MIRPPPRSPLFPYTTLSRSEADGTVSVPLRVRCDPPLYAFELNVSVVQGSTVGSFTQVGGVLPTCTGKWERDRKSTRLNSSHANISYAVFCLKKKKITLVAL